MASSSFLLSTTRRPLWGLLSSSTASFSSSSGHVGADGEPTTTTTTSSATRGQELRSQLEQLGNKLEGTVLFPSDDGDDDDDDDDDTVWNEACETWSKPSPQPAAIVQVQSEQDVAYAVPILARIEKEHGVPFRIKAGGHHYIAYCSMHDGIVLDLQKLNQIQLVEKNETNNNDDDDSSPLAWLGPAVRGTDILQQLVQPLQLAAVTGACPAVAAGGFHLGGGFSYWSRLYGLGSDRLVQARVVLANGTTVLANSTTHAGLFWALQGAGSAGLGVVTALQVELFATQDEQVYGYGKIPDVAQAARFLQSLPEKQLPGSAMIMLFLFPTKFFGQDFVSFYNWYGTGLEHLQQGLAVLNETVYDTLPTETAAGFSADIKSWTESSKMAMLASRHFRVWNGFVMPEQNTVAVWTRLLDRLLALRDELEFVTVEIGLWGGAISDLAAPEDSAFYWRRAVFNVCVNLGVPPEEPNALAVFEEQSARIQAVWTKDILAEDYLQGVYYNYPMHTLDKDEYSAAYFGPNLERLQRIKHLYDPSNVFHHPQSIPPLTSTIS